VEYEIRIMKLIRDNAGQLCVDSATMRLKILLQKQERPDGNPAPEGKRCQTLQPVYHPSARGSRLPAV